MQRFCFHCALADLVPQAAAGAFGPVDAEHWRVTATLTAVSPPAAHAVSAGSLFFQRSTAAGRLNCVLVPDWSPPFIDTPVRFIVYRGIELASLVESDQQTLQQGEGLLRRVREVWTANETAFGSSSAPTLDLLGVDVAGSAELPVETLLAAADGTLGRYARPRVGVGDYLGRFAVDSVSIEIVLADPRPDFTLGRLRAPENVLGAETAAGQSPSARRFLAAIQREQLLAYQDPCHFFTALRARGALDFKGGPPPNLATWIATWWTGIYAYFDFRNEHERSLNFYRNYGPDVDSPAALRVQRAADTPHPVDYDTGGWPLLRADLTTGDFDPVRIQLPVGDNGPTRVHVSSPAGSRFVAVQAGAEPGFTNPVEFEVPREGPVWLPTVFKLRYLRPLDAPPAAAVDYRPLARHRLDNVLDLGVLAVPEAIEPPDRSLRRGRLRRVFLDVNPAPEGFAPAWLASAMDEAGVYLYASRERRTLIDAAAPEVRSGQPLITADRRVASELPLGALRREQLDWNGATIHLADTGAIAPGDLAGVALTRDEYAGLRAAIAGVPLTRATARLQLVPVDTLPMGVRVYSLALHAVAVDAGGALVQWGATPLAGAPMFYSREEDPAFLLSDRFLAGFPAGAVEHPMAHSYIMPDFRVMLRRTPRIERITEAQWDAAGGQVDDGLHNALGQTSGRARTPVTVHGKRLDDEGDTWFHVTLNEATELIRPEFVPSNYEPGLRTRLGLERIAIAGHTQTAAAGTGGWVRAQPDAIVVVAAYDKFERDLRRLLGDLGAAHPDDGLNALMTRLRMLTKERFDLAAGNVPTRRFKENLGNGALSRMFDVLIGTVRADADGKLEPTVTPARGLEDGILAEPARLETRQGESMDTTLSLFRDYTAFHLDGDYVLDLHHLFVGLDVVRGQQAAVARTISAAELRYAQGFQTELSIGGVPLSFVPDGFVHTIPDAVAASLWVGDVAAYYSLLADGSHQDYEDDWCTDHPGACSEPRALCGRHPDPADSRRCEAFKRHYFNASAPDHDLLPDVLAYLLRHELGRRAKVGGATPRSALLATLQWLRDELPARGPAAYQRFFEADLRRKAPGGEPVAWMEAMIVNFALIFAIRGRVQKAILALADDPAALLPPLSPAWLDELLANLAARRQQILAEVTAEQQNVGRIQDLVRVFDAGGQVDSLAATTRFIDWYHRRGGIDFLER